jgi:hypothetical protein
MVQSHPPHGKNCPAGVVGQESHESCVRLCLKRRFSVLGAGIDNGRSQMRSDDNVTGTLFCPLTSVN